jgi:ribosome-associated protein
MKVKLKIKQYNEQKVEIESDFIKLDALLKFAAVVQTGGEAKMLISDGIVSVNGEICTQRGKKIYPDDKVTIDDLRITVVKA